MCLKDGLREGGGNWIKLMMCNRGNDADPGLPHEHSSVGDIYITKGARLNIILKLLLNGRSQVKYILAHD